MFVSVSVSANCSKRSAASMNSGERALVNAECLEAQLYRECPGVLLKKETRQYIVSVRANKVHDPAKDQAEILSRCTASAKATKKEDLRANYFVSHFQKTCPTTYKKLETKNMLTELKEYAEGKTSNENFYSFQKSMTACDVEQAEKKVVLK